MGTAVCRRSLCTPRVGSAQKGQRLQEPTLLGCRCTKPIGLGNCSVSVGLESSCLPHAIGSGFRSYC